MSNINNDRLSKLKKVIGNAIFIVFMLNLLLQVFYYSSNKNQLTKKSFREINEINNAIKKLADIEGQVFKGKEELKYNALKLISPNYFDDYYFLERYLFSYEFKSSYSLNILELRKAGIDESKIKLAADYNFSDSDSIRSYINSLSTDKYFSVYSSYYNRIDYEEHFIRPLSKVLLSNDDILLLKSIQDISYESTEEFEQALKDVLGLDNFKQYGAFITSVKDGIPQWLKNLFYFWLTILLILILARLSLAVFLGELRKKEDEKSINDNINKAISDIEEQPEKIKPVWDLANYTLQKYYNKNLSQVNSIYKLSIVVMLMGFLLIVAILISSIFFNNEIKLDSIGIIAGIITEFIGATFLFIYKSTINQALQHSKSLEDINKVGMSIKIIESIEVNKENGNKIDEAKLEIAKELITTHNKV